MRHGIRHGAMITLLLGAAAILAAAGCSGEKGGGRTAPAGAWGGGKGVALDGKELSLAGVTFRPPATWQDFGPSGMRAASYAYGPVKGDADSATVAVFYFGPGQGGEVAANIDRWVGQMTVPGGGDPAQAAQRDQRTVDGMNVHHVEVAGIYNGASMGGMGAMGGVGGGGGCPGYLMSALVLEAPQGNLFFKLTGPEKTAREMNAAFLAMIAAARKAP